MSAEVAFRPKSELALPCALLLLCPTDPSFLPLLLLSPDLLRPAELAATSRSPGTMSTDKTTKSTTPTAAPASVTTPATTATGLSLDRPPTRTPLLSDSTNLPEASASESPPLTDVVLSPQRPSALPLLLLPDVPVSPLPSKDVTT